MSLYYADTSAVIKLLVEESDSSAFAAFYDAHADAEWVSSALLRVEVARAVVRAMPVRLPDARDLLQARPSPALVGRDSSRHGARPRARPRRPGHVRRPSREGRE